MRTNIEIDDDLIAEAKLVLGVSTKRAAVEEALRRVVDRERRRAAQRDALEKLWGSDPDWNDGRFDDPLAGEDAA